MINHAKLRSNPVLARAIPFLLFIGFLIVGSWIAPRSGQFDLDPASLAVARGLVVAGVLAWFWRSFEELRPATPTPPSHWTLAVATGLIVFGVWIWLGEAGAEGNHSGKFTPLLDDNSLDWPKALLRLAGLAVVVPIMEELFWRSLVMRWITQHDFLSLPPRSVTLTAFAITTALFAVEHDQWVAGAFAGAVYGGIYMWSGNLWIPITSHMVTNASLGLWIIQTRNWHYW